MPEFIIGKLSEVPPGESKVFKVSDKTVAVFNVCGILYASGRSGVHSEARPAAATRNCCEPTVLSVLRIKSRKVSVRALMQDGLAAHHAMRDVRGARWTLAGRSGHALGRVRIPSMILRTPLLSR